MMLPTASCDGGVPGTTDGMKIAVDLYVLRSAASTVVVLLPPLFLASLPRLLPPDEDVVAPTVEALPLACVLPPR